MVIVNSFEATITFEHKNCEFCDIPSELLFVDRSIQARLEAMKANMEGERAKIIRDTMIDAVASFASMTVGSWVGGPEGAILGLTASSTFTASAKTMMADVSSRQTSTRQSRRLEQAFNLTLNLIQARINAGEKPRDDWAPDLINLRGDGQSPAEETLEAVLMKCRDLPRSQCLPYVASIWANAAYGNQPADLVHRVARNSDRLSWHQLVYIAWSAAQRGRYGAKDTMDLWGSQIDAERMVLRADVFELIGHPFTILTPTGNLTSLGKAYHELMGLNGIPAADQDGLERCIFGDVTIPLAEHWSQVHRA